jgi:hypothetical protein
MNFRIKWGNESGWWQLDWAYQSFIPCIFRQLQEHWQHGQQPVIQKTTYITAKRWNEIKQTFLLGQVTRCALASAYEATSLMAILTFSKVSLPLMYLQWQWSHDSYQIIITYNWIWLEKGKGCRLRTNDDNESSSSVEMYQRGAGALPFFSAIKESKSSANS